jgi:molybdopterin converting factor small subunit
MSGITFEEIKGCEETVEVNRLALVRALNDGLFKRRGHAHERMAKRKLRNAANEARYND